MPDLRRAIPPLRVPCSEFDGAVLRELLSILRRVVSVRTKAAWLGDLAKVLWAERQAARLEDEFTAKVMRTGFYAGMSDPIRERYVRSWLRVVKAIERAGTMQALEGASGGSD